jgi:hypothetical protein
MDRIGHAQIISGDARSCWRRRGVAGLLFGLQATPANEVSQP